MPKPEDKKRVKDRKNDHTLHIALLMREGFTKSDAIVFAYDEGKAGLAVRLTGVVK